MSHASSARKPYRPPRPANWFYDLRDLAKFPRRLLFPPDAGVGNVRSMKITPRYEVSLNDVLGERVNEFKLSQFGLRGPGGGGGASNLYVG